MITLRPSSAGPAGRARKVLRSLSEPKYVSRRSGSKRSCQPWSLNLTGDGEVAVQRRVENQIVVVVAGFVEERAVLVAASCAGRSGAHRELDAPTPLAAVQCRRASLSPKANGDLRGDHHGGAGPPTNRKFRIHRSRSSKSQPCR